MEKCPVCNAAYKEGRSCRRCKADLGRLLDTETQARNYQEKAENAYKDKDYGTALRHAERACSLKCTPEAVRLSACAALLSKRYDTAYAMWRRMQGREN